MRISAIRTLLIVLFSIDAHRPTACIAAGESTVERFTGHWRTPGARYFSALVFALLIATSLLALVYQQPRHGLSLTPVGAGVATMHNGSSLSISAINSPLGKVPLIAEDLTPEPDVLPDYVRMDRFFARQSRLAAALDAGGVLEATSGGSARQMVVLTPQPSIPFSCWQQLGIGFLGFAISAWIWAIAPRRLPNQLFGIAGVAMLAFTGTAGVYSSREIALDGRLFWWLSSINTIGAATFGVAMASLFLVYPHRLVNRPLLIALAALFGTWTLAALLRVLPSPAIGGHLAVTAEMALIAVAIGLQIIATRGDPLGRAALRWIGTATFLGAGLFIATTSVPITIGIAPLVDQGWAFSFFLLIHLGVAIGLRRERLFAIESWSFGLLFYGGVTILFVALDLALAVLLGSLSSAAALTGIILLPLLYLPARDWTARRLIGSTDVSAALEQVARVSLVPAVEERAILWRGALQRIFMPLDITAIPAVAEVAIEDDGLILLVPGIGDGDAYRLTLAHRGARLFKPSDLQLARRMVGLANQVDSDRRAYGRGVDAERVRMARDLHDDLAARLMSGLELDDPVRLRETLRASLVEVRDIVNATLSRPAPVVDVLADSRTEAAERLEAVAIGLDWVPIAMPGTLGAEAAKALTSALRELTTNVIRHSRASQMTVSARLHDGLLHLRAEDDGSAGHHGSALAGNGLNNIVQRLRAIGGSADYAFEPSGFRMTLALPVSG